MIKKSKRLIIKIKAKSKIIKIKLKILNSNIKYKIRNFFSQLTFVISNKFINLTNFIKYFNSKDKVDISVGYFDDDITNKYINGDEIFLIYKISPNFTSLYKTDIQMSSFNYELNTLYSILARYEKITLYKYDNLTAIPFEKENENKVINLHVQKQNELIQKGNELLVPNYFLVIPYSDTLNSDEIIGTIDAQVTSIKIDKLSMSDYPVFEDVINMNYNNSEGTYNFDGEYMKIDDEYSKLLEVVNYTSEEQYFTFLTNITNYGGVDFQLSIYKINKEKLKSNIDDSIGDIDTDLSKATKSTVIKSKQKQLHGLLNLVDQLDDSESDIFKTRLVFKFRGTSKSIIENDINEFKLLFKTEYKFRNMFFENPIRLWSLNTKQSKVLNLSDEKHIDYKYLTTEMLAHTGIFNFKDLIDVNGMYLNESPYGRVVVNMNYTSSELQRNVPNFLITGITGGGKSTFAKDTILHQLNQNNHVVTIDVQGDFVRLAESIGGLNIDVARDIKFNPLEVQNWGVFEQVRSCITDHISFLKGFINMANNDEITNKEMIVLDLALVNFYEAKKINPSTISYPNFDDFREFIKDYKEYESIDIYTRTLTQGSYANYFNYSSSDIKMKDYSYINYDISKLSPEVQNIMLYIIFNKFKKSMNENKKYNADKSSDFRRIYLFMDEAHRMLSNNDVIAFVTKSVNEIVREARKFYAAVGFGTQSMLDLKTAPGIFEQIPYRYFFKQDPSILQDISELLNLPLISLEKLSNCRNGEGLLVINNEVYDVKHEPHQELINNYFDGGKTGV